jgi:hypothetical protein
VLVASVAHTPPQFVWPGGQVVVHPPFTQTWPVEHAWLQLPQSATLLLVSRQLLAHWVKPDEQPPEVHSPLTQRSPGGHEVPQVPQWLPVDVRSVQAPSQLALPGQVVVQAPLEQTLPPWQTLKTPPQLLESDARFVQAVVGPSAVKDCPGTSDPGQDEAQAPFTHTPPAGHSFPQLPQFRVEVSRVTHKPLHFVVFGGQAEVQVPPTHTWLEEHAFPQLPQFSGLLRGSTQPDGHSERPFAQVPVLGKSM